MARVSLARSDTNSLDIAAYNGRDYADGRRGSCASTKGGCIASSSGAEFLSLLAKHKKEKDQLLSQYRNLETSNAKNSAKLQDSQASTGKLRQQLSKCQHELNVSRKALERTAEERKHWESQISASKMVIRKLENKIHSLVENSEVHQELERMTRECTSLVEERNRMAEELTVAEETAHSESTEVNILRAALEESARHIRKDDGDLHNSGSHAVSSSLLYDVAAARETIETMKLHLRQALLDQDRATNEAQRLHDACEKAHARFDREQLDHAELREEHEKCLEHAAECKVTVEQLEKSRSEVEQLRAEVCRLEGDKEHRTHVVHSARESKEQAWKELQEERDETGRRLNSHFSRIRELTQYGELLQVQLEAERTNSSDEREKRRDAEEKLLDIEGKLQTMRQEQIVWERENTLHATQVRSTEAKIIEVMEELSRARMENQKQQDVMESTQEENAQLEKSLEAERQLNRAAEKNIIALVEEKKDLVRDAEKSYRRLQEALLAQPKMEEELLTQTRQIEHLKRNREVIEESLNTQLQHARCNLEDVSVTRSKLSDELLHQKRENEKIRALLSMETLAKHRLL